MVFMSLFCDNAIKDMFNRSNPAGIMVSSWTMDKLFPTLTPLIKSNRITIVLPTLEEKRMNQNSLEELLQEVY